MLARHVDRLDQAGLVLDMVQLPLPSSGIWNQHQSPGIVLGLPGERDREIDGICRLIETLGELGIGAAKYNFNILGIPRTESERGRGGAVLSTFRHDQTTDDEVMTIAGRVDADNFWERIIYFLERVVPVAEASKVRLACHPHDPLTRPGYRGVDRVLGSAEGLMRFVQIAESPYHGLNFCQGTVAESMENPRAEIGEVIRWFGSRKKIFNVHFRNIKGGRYSFTEEFPDAGDMDMAGGAQDLPRGRLRRHDHARPRTAYRRGILVRDRLRLLLRLHYRPVPGQWLGPIRSLTGAGAAITACRRDRRRQGVCAEVEGHCRRRA